MVDSNKPSIDKLRMETQMKINNVSCRFAKQISVGDEVIIPRIDELTKQKSLIYLLLPCKVINLFILWLFHHF